MNDWREFFLSLAVEYCAQNGLSVEKLKKQDVEWSHELAIFAEPNSAKKSLRLGYQTIWIHNLRRL
ncbi:MAG: hypothetical protein LBT21_04280 [Oscillospiraceae bacterium]|jgi:NOL1/NOP2/fmu family ribosome biogenesis protein|nr:hypothetical protein [Oscillospiraceae bacterium]